MNKKFLVQVLKLFLSLALAISIGCSTYSQNRKRDFQDIFTLGVEEKSYGIGLRLSYLPLGFFFQGSRNDITNEIEGQGFGLRGGSFSQYHSDQLIFGFLGGESFYSGEVSRDEKGKIVKEKKIPIVKEERDNLKSYRVRYFDFFNDPPIERQKRSRNKVKKIIIEDLTRDVEDPELMAYMPRDPPKKNGYPDSYPYQVEIQFGLFYAVRLGFNFAELVDFFLGIGKIDILDDDTVFSESSSEETESDIREEKELQEEPEVEREIEGQQTNSESGEIQP